MKSIKILQFKKCSNLNEQEQINWYNQSILHRNSTKINIIFFSQQKASPKIQYLQDWADDMYSKQIQIYKSYQSDSFDYFIRQIYTNNNIKTFCIIHQQRLKEFSEILIKNQDQEWVKKFKNIGVIYLLNKIQKVNPINYIIENVRLITLNPEHIQEFIEKQITQMAQNKLNASKSSLDTEQERIFEDQFNKKIEKININPQSRRLRLQPLQYVINNQTPGVGSYNLLPTQQQISQNKKGISFSGKKKELFQININPGVGQYTVNKQMNKYPNQHQPRIFFPAQSRDTHPERWNQSNIRNFTYNQW